MLYTFGNRIKINHEKILENTICVMIFSIFLNNILYGLQFALHFNHGIVSNSIKILVSFLFIINFLLIIVKNKIKKKLIFLLFLVSIVSILQFVFFKNTIVFYKDTLVYFLVSILTAVILFMYINDYQSFFEKLVKTAIYISFVTLISFLLFGNNMFNEGYSMGFSNSLILPSNILIYSFFKGNNKFSKKIVLVLLVLTNVISILFCGSRGSLVCIFIFYIFNFFNNSSKTNKEFIIKIFISMILFVLIINIENVILFLANLAKSFGFNSRTLHLLIEDVGHDSGRTIIWETILRNFLSSPFSINGVNGEYLITGGYSHSFILEILYDFGVLIGLPIIIYLNYNFLKTIIFKDNRIENDIKKIFLFSFFPLIFWSSSIYTNLYFWIYLFGLDNKNNR